jgi:putative heme iron utilization protein
MAVGEQSNTQLARALLKMGGPATLATLDPAGAPFASYVISAPAEDGSPLLLLSRLAVHTHNLQRDVRASLLMVREPEEGTESLAASRLTLTGRALPDNDPQSLARYLACHPDAARYSEFADFSVYRFEIISGHLVAGFGRIVTLSREGLLGAAGGYPQSGGAD